MSKKAGYNSENLLKKIIEIQNIVLREQKRGYLSLKETYHQFIADEYFISFRTLQNYLGRNAKQELADIEESKPSNRVDRTPPSKSIPCRY